MPAVPARPASRQQRIVLVTAAGSITARRFLEAWRSWNFVPAAVVVENPPVQPVGARLARMLQREGIGGIARRLRRIGNPLPPAGGPANTGAPASGAGPPASIFPPRLSNSAPARGSRRARLNSLTSQPALAAIEAIQPDLLVHAGAGLIRRPLLAVSRLGMINAHMGILPFYRGVNVAEWAAFNGDPIGCSVHLIDDGIDTGDILAIRQVEAARADSIASMRALVNAAQMELLGEIVCYVAATGELPPRHPQDSGAGSQFFTIHPEIRRVLETELSASPAARDPKSRHKISR